MRVIFLAALFSFGACSASASNLISGNTLLGACTAPEGSDRQGFCVGYVVGVVEGMLWGASWPAIAASEEVEGINAFTSVALGFCSPESSTWQQFVDIIVKDFIENPLERHLPARGLIQTALAEAFPCS